MDPTAAVTQLAALSAELDRLNGLSEQTDTTHAVAAAAEEMCMVWDGLNAWLSKGGALPDQWTQQR